MPKTGTSQNDLRDTEVGSLSLLGSKDKVLFCLPVGKLYFPLAAWDLHSKPCRGVQVCSGLRGWGRGSDHSEVHSTTWALWLCQLREARNLHTSEPRNPLTGNNRVLPHRGDAQSISDVIPLLLQSWVQMTLKGQRLLVSLSPTL